MKFFLFLCPKNLTWTLGICYNTGDMKELTHNRKDRTMKETKGKWLKAEDHPTKATPKAGEGEVVRVFHGSASEQFDVFGETTQGAIYGEEGGQAFFFTDSKKAANYYKENALEYADEGAVGFVGEYDLNMKNPYYTTPQDNKSIQNEGFQKTIDKAKQLGHDSIVLRDDGIYGKATTYAVFSPSQITKATPEAGKGGGSPCTLKKKICP